MIDDMTIDYDEEEKMVITMMTMTTMLTMRATDDDIDIDQAEVSLRMPYTHTRFK